MGDELLWFKGVKRQIKSNAYKHNPDETLVHSTDDALKFLRMGNPEFCKGLSDYGIILALIQGPIYTDFRKFYIE